MNLRPTVRSSDRVASYLEMVAHKCPGCGSKFEGDEGFLRFIGHLDLSVACRHEFDEFLDMIREGHSGGD